MYAASGLPALSITFLLAGLLTALPGPVAVVPLLPTGGPEQNRLSLRGLRYLLTVASPALGSRCSTCPRSTSSSAPHQSQRQFGKSRLNRRIHVSETTL